MKYLFANWKMYLSSEDSLELARAINNMYADNVSLAVFPNILSFQNVYQELEGTDIACGAQNVSWTPQGAYTGAVSAHLFAESGAQYALIGHSERRYIFGETNGDIRKKLEACITEKLTPVLCIGETKHDRDNNKTEYRIKKQIMRALEGIDVQSTDLIVAYEPVWAIGTGDACEVDEAVRMIKLIKSEIKQYVDKHVPVLYGGSVNSENMVSYVSHEVIDGVLVGHASIQLKSYQHMVSLLQKV